jgi:hypothetical protein
MGADWYYPEIWYGFIFVPPVTQSLRSFLSSVYALREFVGSPFEIKCVLDSFHSRMEFDEHGNRELDQLATVIFGFKPSNNLDQTMTWARELEEYIQNPMFMGLEFQPEARFITGIEWLSEVEDTEESDLSSSSLSAVSTSSSEACTSDSFLSDHDDTVNYHGADDDAEAEVEEAEVEETDGEAENHQKSDEEAL